MDRAYATNGRGFVAIGIHQPKFDANVGGILRAAYIFGAKVILFSGHRVQHVPTDTPKALRHIPLIRVSNVMDYIPYDCVPIAVELDNTGTPLPQFCHPVRAFYVFGAEDGGLPRSILERCAATIYIPSKFSLNVAATANVVLYDRMAKAA